MIKFGQVTAYDEKTRKATVTYIRPDACAKCGACGSLNKSGTIELKADCKPGDWVRVVLPDNRFLSAAALAYVLPLIGFLAGLAAGYLASGKNELWAMGGGIAGVALSMGVLALVQRVIADKPDWTPHIDCVYDERPQADDLGCGGGAD